MNMIGKSFRLERGSSLNNRLERANSSLLASELIAPKIAKVTAYEKLSQSMRLADEYAGSNYGGHDNDDPEQDHRRRNKSGGGWSFLTKFFSSRKIDSNDVKPPEIAMGVEKRKTSTWLPDPQQRWPVQGW